jgi:hypothetical protein
MVRAGVAQRVAMSLIGLQTDSLFRRYAVVDEEVLREATAKLAALHEAQRAEASKVAAMPAKGKRRAR